MRRVAKVLSLCVVALMAAAGASAQEPVPSLQDLVGAKGGDGELALRNRGYTWLRTNKSDTESYSYWREDQNRACVGIRTVNGRYASIVYVPQSDCQGGGQSSSAAVQERKDEFETICGVIVNRKNYRYRCKVEDFYSGSKKTQTVLYFPDQTIRLTWKSGNLVGLQFEGMVPQEARYSTSEGETNFVFEDKTYFYISDKEAARMEVESFQD